MAEKYLATLPEEEQKARAAAFLQRDFRGIRLDAELRWTDPVATANAPMHPSERRRDDGGGA